MAFGSGFLRRPAVRDWHAGTYISANVSTDACTDIEADGRFTDSEGRTCRHCSGRLASSTHGHLEPVIHLDFLLYNWSLGIYALWHTFIAAPGVLV